ncbi:MAG: fimbrillin family protein [Muribaculaceae bacterium]|nr:fimbrillin family protein [Muribaculaceae bacterium]
MKKYNILAAAALALVACNNEENYVESPVAAQISATIGDALSRASDETWNNGDEIGITMGSKYFNMKYTTSAGDGKFAGKTMYFSNKKDDVTFTAYYPFAGTEGEAAGSVEATTDAANQAPDKQPAIDFLYATTQTSGAHSEVKFEFSHKMGKLTLKFKNGNDGTDVSKITSYKIDGLILKGKFDTASGDCAAADDEASATLAMALNEGDVQHDAAVPSLLIFPQSTADKTVKLTITDSDGQAYACNLTFDNGRIESGNNYQFIVTVNKTGLTVNPSTITNWTDKVSSDNNADPIDPEPES